MAIVRYCRAFFEGTDDIIRRGMKLLTVAPLTWVQTGCVEATMGRQSEGIRTMLAAPSVPQRPRPSRRLFASCSINESDRRPNRRTTRSDLIVAN